LTVAGIVRVTRFEQDDLRFRLRDWPMFDTARDDYELSVSQDDVLPIPQLNNAVPRF
jgi:hypothetical protein